VAFDGRESIQLLGVSSSALFQSGSVPNTCDLRESKGKDKKDGQPGIGLVKPCIATWGPQSLIPYTTRLP